MADSLSTYEPKRDSLWLRFSDGDEIKLRVLTLDPVITEKIWPNSPDKIDTKYSFVIWNWNENKAQILQVGPGLLNRFTKIHRDGDFDPLNKIDIKITATGEMLERRYEVDVMPKATPMTKEAVAEAAKLKLEELVKESKGRLSEYVDSDEATDHSEPEPEIDSGDPEALSGYDKAKAQARKIDGKEDGPGEPDEDWIPEDEDVQEL